ncbi:MAG: carbohydrate kinase [Planctomycetes bacterium]|nr:carbohydrate kinase [Planctomycetota bacterium]
MYLLGYDSGTSSIKATLLEVDTGRVVASSTYPPKEMPIISNQPGWAEQNPQDWWSALKNATKILLDEARIDTADIKAIGITYQMHGLVCVDKNKNILRPSIIWCDSRAVPYGEKAKKTIGAKKCMEVMLNHPGNFTAAKLAWVKENEPHIYDKIDKVMLPGDYLAMKMTDTIITTKSGLSEGIFWDFPNQQLAQEVMDAFDFDSGLIPKAADTFEIHGELTTTAAEELGLKTGTAVSYRAGDQPNNAFSLGVLDPGQVAATAGTSGVVYGISDKPCYDEKSRVNTFVHVNNTANQHRYGSLLCINGTGILNSWLKHNTTAGIDYPAMNELASRAPIGSDGLSILPYGNGAERTLENKVLGASVHGLNFNIHSQTHLMRAGQEGIASAFNYGLDIMKAMGLKVKNIRAGKANMFLSPIFAKTLATIAGARIELYNTDGSQGAARGAGIGVGAYKDPSEAFAGLQKVDEVEPNTKERQRYRDMYDNWLTNLRRADGMADC